MKILILCISIALVFLAGRSFITQTELLIDRNATIQAVTDCSGYKLSIWKVFSKNSANDECAMMELGRIMAQTGMEEQAVTVLCNTKSAIKAFVTTNNCVNIKTLGWTKIELDRKERIKQCKGPYSKFKKRELIKKYKFNKCIKKPLEVKA